jgi:hypothetical protein
MTLEECHLFSIHDYESFSYVKLNYIRTDIKTAIYYRGG